MFLYRSLETIILSKTAWKRCRAPTITSRGNKTFSHDHCIHSWNMLPYNIFRVSLFHPLYLICISLLPCLLTVCYFLYVFFLLFGYYILNCITGAPYVTCVSFKKMWHSFGENYATHYITAQYKNEQCIFLDSLSYFTQGMQANMQNKMLYGSTDINWCTHVHDM